MAEKSKIEKFITKYYLNGLAESAQVVSNAGSLQTVFKNSEGNLRGEIIFEDVNLPDGTIGVYNTKGLLNYLSILDEDITVNYKGTNSDGSIVSLELSDTRGKKALHNASPLDLIDFDGKKAVVKNYDVEFCLNNETIADILSGFTAVGKSMDLQSLTFLKDKKQDKFLAIFNYAGNKTEQIEVEMPTKVDDDDFEDVISFPATAVKEILSINGKGFEEAKLSISNKGLMRLYFKDNKVTSEYWIRKNV